jgi:peptidoglycan hydrolase-like protein with peptidoglycan-binding domain
VAIDYNIQRNKLYTTLLSTETSKGNPFLDKKYSFTDFYKRFFSADQGVKDLYNALTTTKKKSGEFFLDPKKYTLANFYFSFGCDLTFAPKEFCEAQKSKFSGNYVDGKAKLSITDISGNLSYILKSDKDITIPVINKKIDPEIKGNLTNKVGDVYVDKKSWGETRFNFIDDGKGNIIQINVEVVASAMNKELKLASYNFTKNDSEVSPEEDKEKEEDGEWTWREVPKAAWEALKKAGKWVKEEGGKFWAYLNTEGEARDAEENIWGCINKYNENWGYYKLLRGGTGTGPDYFYEFSTYKIDGKKTIFVYFEDGKFVLRSFDTNQNIPGQSGKWSCLEGGGYKLDYDDGRKAVFGMNEKESKIQSSSDQEGNEKSNQPISACKSMISCPSFVDYVNKNLEYKVCMKCPEIQNFQNNPVLKVIYFRKLKQNNLPERTDDIFGPIMKSAIEEYQEMNGITKTGTINHNTYIALKKDSKGRGA